MQVRVVSINCADVQSTTERASTAQREERWHFVAAQAGVLSWLARKLPQVRAVAHPELPPVELFGPGDVVCGPIPRFIASALTARGARCLRLECSMAMGVNDENLTATILECLGAKLVEHGVGAVHD